jgi:hypothetical protein
MIKSNYQHGYTDENGFCHVVTKHEKGWNTYSYDILIATRKAKGTEKQESENIKNHSFVGKSFIGVDNKVHTVTRVLKHQGFGTYYTALYIDAQGSHGFITLTSEGNGIEKKYADEQSIHYENLLLEQCK